MDAEIYDDSDRMIDVSITPRQRLISTATESDTDARPHGRELEQ